MKCRKFRYYNEAAALATLRKLQRKGPANRRLGRVERGAYECAACGGWHLTSRSAS
jgi:hypothetical protein